MVSLSCWRVRLRAIEALSPMDGEGFSLYSISLASDIPLLLLLVGLMKAPLTVSLCSSLCLISSSSLSVEESYWVGSSFGFQFLVFQLVRTKPLAFSKFVASFRCSLRLWISASIRPRACAHSRTYADISSWRRLPCNFSF